jgi:hypothetical protein
VIRGQIPTPISIYRNIPDEYWSIFSLNQSAIYNSIGNNNRAELNVWLCAKRTSAEKVVCDKLH